MNRTGISLLAGLGILLAACAPSTPPLDLDGLVEALTAGGAEVEEGGEVEQEFFSVPGRVLLVDGQEVQVFEYADEAARSAESGLIQPDGSPNPTTMVSWIDQPNFWADGRLIVLYVGRESDTIELLSGILDEPLTEPWPG